ncbi:MAG: aspartate kinase [Legionellales bacterium]|nr:aspartate kinase [Legionellales bacterium]
MALLIQKFGGTSLETLPRIQQVADKIVATRREGHDIVVVVSAMGGDTDRLIHMAKQMQEFPDPREYSMLVSCGEQISIALLAMALRTRGCPAVSFTGWQAGIKTDDRLKKARIQKIECDKLREEVRRGIIPVVAGFQGISEAGDITTLGRGGSDTTAVALAAALQADECQIYTDVDGVYTTDPRVEPRARRLDQITFEEMLEMASLGAKVLQIRSVEFAGKYNVPLRVLSTFQPGPGTLITLEGGKMENAIVSGIAFNRSEAKITIRGVPDLPGVAYRILGPISEANIEVDMIIQNIAADATTDFTFTVHRDDYERALEILNGVCEDLKARVVLGDNHIAKLSLVGVGMRSHSGIASKMFSTLGKEGINMQLISTSEIKISVVIDEKYIELGVRALHAAFDLDKTAQEEFDPRPEKNMH